MLGRRQRPAQDFIENPLSHPQRQSREAGSCMGAEPSAPATLNVWFLDRLAG
jgi:hypothetical protein